jgi:putative hydrolase of the HAD superfamily/pyrimidine and pyridine-specific 5'-nucleotidase
MECVFFDCDDCLYKNNWATMTALDAKFAAYCEAKLGVTKSRMMELFHKHGTSLCGLVREGHIADSQVQEFLAEVHDIPLEIDPDPELRQMLLALPHKCWVFTAATPEHARRCLDKLGVQDLFMGIVACSSPEMFGRVGYVSKHDPACFKAAMDIAGIPHEKAGNCMLLDDSVRNIKTAKSVGWHTVLVGRQDRKGQVLQCNEADVIVSTLHEIPDYLPWLLQSPKLDVSKEKGMNGFEPKKKRVLKPLESSPGRRVLRRVSTPLSPRIS